jgi:hypothetical protein
MVRARSFPSFHLWLSLQFGDAAQGRHVGICARFSGKRAEVGRDIGPQPSELCASTPEIRIGIPLELVSVFHFTLVKADPESMRTRPGYPV